MARHPNQTNGYGLPLNTFNPKTRLPPNDAPPGFVANPKASERAKDLASLAEMHKPGSPLRPLKPPGRRS